MRIPTCLLKNRHGILRARFEQHSDLRELYLSTGDASIVEIATVDNNVNHFAPLYYPVEAVVCSATNTNVIIA